MFCLALIVLMLLTRHEHGTQRVAGGRTGAMNIEFQ
jgi:hypothetical protein